MAHTSVSLLRRALAADAIASGAMGILFIVAAGPLSVMLGYPTTLLTSVGLSLLPWTAFVGWLATRSDPPRAAVWTVIGLNVLWVIESVLVLFGDFAPTGLGVAFVIAQAVVVGVFAELEYVGVRRAMLATA